MAWKAYTITALPSAWNDVQHVALGPDGSWGDDPSNWGDPSFLYVNGDPDQGLDPDGRGYWGLQNRLDENGEPMPLFVQLSAAALVQLQGILGVVVTETLRA